MNLFICSTILFSNSAPSWLSSENPADKIIKPFVFFLIVVSFYSLYEISNSFTNIFVTRNPYFLLDKHKIKVSVQGELTDLSLLKNQLEALLEEEVKKNGKVNVAALDLGKLRYSFLELNPQVDQVNISIHHSNGLCVDVVDKKPVARLQSQHGAIVTESNFIIKSVKQNLHLPIIIGIKDFKSILKNEANQNIGIKSSIELLKILSTTNYGIQLDVRFINCSLDSTLGLILDGANSKSKHCKVIISRKYMKKDLSRVCLILDTRASAGKETEFIDASQRSFVPVKPRYRD